MENLIKNWNVRGKLTANNEPLYIGARGGNQRFLNGALDEIKIYDYALTQDELRMDMDNPVADVLPQGKLTTTMGAYQNKINN